MMIRPPLLSLSLVLLLSSPVTPVDRSKFRTCAQSSFCRRARAQPEGSSGGFQVRPGSLRAGPTGAEAVLVNGANGVEFRMEMQALEDR